MLYNSVCEFGIYKWAYNDTVKIPYKVADVPRSAIYSNAGQLVYSDEGRDQNQQPNVLVA